jgi:two-component system sensor histidine kinase DegS
LRLGQEAINNAVKHANAEHIFVNLGFAPKGLQLCVRDDGKGFHYDATENGTDHFGLIGMRERAERMGGTLWIYSANGSGTEIIVDVPINN